MTFIELLTYPYSTAASELAPTLPGLSLPLKWIALWVAGSFPTLTFLAMTHTMIFSLCRAISGRVDRLRAMADKGATFDTRRRNAQWSVRINGWLHAIERRSWLHRESDRPIALIGRLGEPTLRSRRVEHVIGFTHRLVGLARAAATALVSWFGLYSVAATTWVTAQDQIRSAARYVADSMHPGGGATLAFTVVAFLAVNAVNWKRRGLSKWRADHLTRAYSDLDQIQAHLTRALAVHSTALCAWYAQFAESLPDIHRTARHGAAWSLLPYPARSLWSSIFDAAYRDIAQEIEAITDISTKQRYGAALQVVTPPAATPLVLDPATHLKLTMFSPETRAEIHTRQAAATNIAQQYAQCLHESIATAINATKAHQSARLYEQIQGPTIDLVAALGAPSEGSDNALAVAAARYNLSTAPLISPVLQCLEAELRSRFGAIDFINRRSGRLPEGQDSPHPPGLDDQYWQTDPVLHLRLHNRLPGAITSALNEAERTLRAYLTAESLQVDTLTTLLDDELAVPYMTWLPGPRYPSVVDAATADRCILERTVSGAIGGAGAAAAAELHRQLDDLVRLSSTSRMYQSLLEYVARAGFDTEAELHAHLATVAKHLFPRTMREQLLAAFNR
ncbi:hypothetical protein [Mycobacteroides abscessus]|uniref:hypothetical protein n=1 Tax=Mycobacteroides abscessus TaxID=36809 RepID=UPI001056FF10|nr:hypothetical protein [Mycobacteroides abscessus]